MSSGDETLTIIEKMVHDFDRKCELEGHAWAATPTGNWYCQCCGKVVQYKAVLDNE